MYDIEEILESTKVEPREYQQRIMTKALDNFIEKQVRSVLIESPTGSGKTIMALMIAKAMYEIFDIKIGWVAMRRHLLKQAKKEMKNKEIDVPLKFISMFEKNLPTDLDMLIVDEAQHDVTGSMMHIHSIIQPKFILGMTATPFRHDRIKLCFDTVIKDAGIPTLIRDGYLSSYHHYTIPEWGVEEVVKHYLREQERWGKSLMYFHRLEQCFQAQNLLIENGIKVEVVHGGSDTDQQLKDFHKNKIKVLINCMKLTEGFDCPDLKTVFCRPSCKSVTIQMCGRVLRKHKDHPHKQIVQNEKTPYTFQKTALAQLQHVWVNDAWRTLEVNKELDDINQRTIKALARIDVSLPVFITKQKVKQQVFNPNAEPIVEMEQILLREAEQQNRV